jgi:hypothetical protein
MPARLDLTPEQALERIREQTRLRVKRYRERRNAAPINEGSVTARSGGASNGALKRHPPQTPPSPPLSLEREIRTALEPLTPRGYVHDPRFWVLASEEYPSLRLELEALKLVDWLTEPRNAKRRCSVAFLDNWLKKAEADRLTREAAQRNGNGAHHGPLPVRADPPIAYQGRNPGEPSTAPLKGPLSPADLGDYQQFRATQPRVPVAQRAMAKLKGGTR